MGGAVVGDGDGGVAGLLPQGQNVRQCRVDGYLLEGMACPGGCIAGAGTLRPIEQSHKEVEAFSSEAKFTCANDTPYMDYLPLIEEKDKIRKL